ncbi:hypothetical protein ABE10_12625 [Bacillus toyonensis]|nr:hypothetical protein [Bacillus toyonensis]
MKTKLIGGTAAALAVAGLAVLAPSAAHADPGAHVGAPLSVCGAEAGAQVTVIESVPARGSVTSVAEADAGGCTTFDGVGTAQLSVTVISGSSAGYVSYAPACRGMQAPRRSTGTTGA